MTDKGTERRHGTLTAKPDDEGAVIETSLEAFIGQRRNFRSSILVLVAAGWIGLLVILALTADWLPIANPEEGVSAPRIGMFQSWSEPLGTDGVGRSIMSRVIFGARASLTVGMLAVAVGLLLGGAIGLTAGYLRGKTDLVIGVLTDTLLSFPGLVLLLAIGAILGSGIKTLIIGLGAISLPVFLRMTRANTLRFTDREFVQSARLLGASSFRIIRREILPNVVPPLVAYAVIVMATLITAEAALSFLGLGINRPTPSWGNMIADGQFELAEHPHLVFVPATVLAITVFAFNAVGDWVRAKLDIGQSKI